MISFANLINEELSLEDELNTRAALKAAKRTLKTGTDAVTGNYGGTSGQFLNDTKQNVGATLHGGTTLDKLSAGADMVGDRVSSAVKEIPPDVREAIATYGPAAAGIAALGLVARKIYKKVS